MSANGADAPVRFPSAATRGFFVSGYADGAEALGGTAAVVDEPVGDGRTVAFGFEPNFRAFTDGTQQILRNAIFGRSPRATATRRARSAARVSARALQAAHDPVRLVVATRGASAARSLLAARGLRYRAVHAGDRTTFLIRGTDEAPWTRALPDELRRAAVPVVMYRVP